MEIHEKHLFDEVLNQAVSRFSERIVQRCQGTENALACLKEDSESEGIWLGKFVENFFAESLLNNSGGAAFILQALEKKKLSGQYEGTAGDIMQKMAGELFGELVKKKSIESLERAMAYGGA